VEQLPPACAGTEEIGFALGEIQSPILPLIIGDAENCMRLSEQLLERGSFSLRGFARRPCRRETSRLRITLMATHTREHLEKALAPSRNSRNRHDTDHDKLKQLDHSYLWHPFTQMQEWLGEEPCIISRADGNFLIDVQGRRYLDGVSSLWCNVHGHRKKELDDALRAPARADFHSTFLGLSHVPGIQLAEKLIGIVRRVCSGCFTPTAAPPPSRSR